MSFVIGIYVILTQIEIFTEKLYDPMRPLLPETVFNIEKAINFDLLLSPGLCIYLGETVGSCLVSSSFLIFWTSYLRNFDGRNFILGLVLKKVKKK